MFLRARTCLWALGLPLILTSAVLGQDIAVVPATPAPPTLWSFLGIPQGARKVHGAVFNQKGNHPNIEKKPPLKAIGDPLNLLSPNDAIKQAAKVKQEEDLAPQKIKAIKYLASIGCGCYDKDGEITKALIAASEDCTEDVRLTTMEELHNIACGKCCTKCGMTCCCKEPLLRKLAQIAYEKDEFGCYLEPSKRVRDMAARVLQCCCPSPIPPILEADKPPVAPESLPPVEPERPRRDGSPIEGERPLSPISGIRSPARGIETQTIGFQITDDSVSALTSSRAQLFQATKPVAIINEEVVASATPNPRGGVVIGYDAVKSIVYVHFEDQGAVVPIGERVHIRVDPARGAGFRGTWRVVASAAGRANLVPDEKDGDCEVRPGDHVMFGEPAITVAPVSFIVK